jgi:hypothetical protein
VRPKWTLLLSTLVFALCITPAVVSYEPYSFTFDDSDYLARSIAVSQAFWSGNKHGLRVAMVNDRPPVMTLLGIPWGPLTSWDAAGKCFITLAVLIAFFIAACLFLLLRVGLRPLYLVFASVCIFAAIGPEAARPHRVSSPTSRRTPNRSRSSNRLYRLSNYVSAAAGRVVTICGE